MPVVVLVFVHVPVSIIELHNNMLCCMFYKPQPADEVEMVD